MTISALVSINCGNRPALMQSIPKGVSFFEKDELDYIHWRKQGDPLENLTALIKSRSPIDFTGIYRGNNFFRTLSRQQKDSFINKLIDEGLVKVTVTKHNGKIVTWIGEQNEARL